MESKQNLTTNPFLLIRQKYWGNKVEEQRLWLLAYISICVLVGTMLMCFGVFGPSHYVPKLINMGVFIGVLSLNLLFMYGHVSLYYTLGWVMVLIEVSLGTGIVSSVIPGPFYSVDRAMADLAMSLILAICAINGYFRYAALVVGILSLGCYVVGLQFTTDTFLSNFFPFYLFLVVTGVSLGYVMVNNVTSLNDEKETLQRFSKQVRDNLDLTPDQLNALLELSSETAPTMERKADLFDLLGEKAKLRLFERVKDVIDRRRMQIDLLEQVLPELSKTELAICRLVLHEKKLSEMCMLLGKTKSNITCQRSHIRSKLGLNPEDDLREKLLERLNDQMLKG